MIRTMIQKVKVFFRTLESHSGKAVFKPAYKLIEISEEEDEYVVVIQLIGKNIVFNAKPEELLADDSLVDQFSPRDIRALTYLGYLGINAPKYKILAKNLSQHENAAFWIKKKGDKKAIIKTAEQIMNETDIIQSMNAEDAKMVGYTAATESVLNERKEKHALLAQNKRR